MSAATYGPLELQSFLAQFYDGSTLTCVPFAYNATFVGLAPAAVANQIVTIAANADFLLLALHHRASIAAAAQTVSTKTAPFVRGLITDTGSSESFTNVAVDLENYSQNDAKPNALPFPRLIAGLTSLNVQVTNYSAAETYLLDLYLEGLRVRKL